MATAFLFLAIFIASGAVTTAAPDELRVVVYEKAGWPMIRRIAGSADDFEGKLCMGCISSQQI